VIKTLKKWNIEEFYYIKSFTYRQILKEKYIEEINVLYNIFYTKLQVKIASIKENKIKEAIERRQQDLEFNQKRMIDNVMEREFKKINIEDILIVDDEEIKNKVVDHFQNCVGTISVDKELPDYWKQEYDSNNQTHILPSAYDSVMEHITIEEILEVTKELPNGKACGPSGITYEDIKLTILPLKNSIQEIFNEIMDSEKIPKQWKKANIYPIPKPKPWEYDLNNTRPITLLETLRKMFMKIITNRLSDANILQGYQFAGLPKKLTFEPLRIINKLINYANEENKELWFFLLDMSKAYDRVNTYMLKKAMRRIKIPEKLCNIIIGMFKGRTNQVFTPSGLTAPFDMWRLFLHCYGLYSTTLYFLILKTGLGFKISAKEYIDIYEGTYREKSLTFPGCGYMDDTSFLTNNKLDMKRILKIADSFYTLNDIKINKSKSALLLRLKNKKYLAREITIKFGNEEINIQLVQHNKMERFFGV
jgi:hypothetical protein